MVRQSCREVNVREMKGVGRTYEKFREESKMRERERECVCVRQRDRDS